MKEEAEFEGVTAPERARRDRLGHTVSDLCPNVSDLMSYSSYRKEERDRHSSTQLLPGE